MSIPIRTLRSAATRLSAAAILFAPAFVAAQGPAAKPNWQNLDLQADSVFGISTERAYKELLANLKATPVRVAVIDNGVDIAHEDLQKSLWANPKDKAGNKKDDDKNGYADDVRGWNFIGSAKGNVEFDNLELTRLVRAMRIKYGTLSDTGTLTAVERDSLTMFRKISGELDGRLAAAKRGLAGIEGFQRVMDTVLARIGKPDPTAQELQSYQPQNNNEARVVQMLGNVLQQGGAIKTFRNDQIIRGLKQYKEQIEYNLNVAYDPRAIVGDNAADDNERFYGSSDVKGPDSDHGTHVAGIIAAMRDNTAGIKGVADNVMIIAVRAVPSGDERDKDVANAIRYAVDNGAKVVNMSFGKGYSWNKKVVDDAVKYAMSKDVLLVHAAGNDNNDLDKTKNFPTRTYEDGSGAAGAWIEVGASGWKNDQTLKAPFSNYGKTTVDVFAPGVRIYSTTPEGTYADHDGTSMAAPVVSGLAALIRSRYPQLTAVQVKDIIMKSVVKVEQPVLVPEGQSARQVPFSELCISGGVVNAYNALKLAAEYK